MDAKPGPSEWAFQAAPGMIVVCVSTPDIDGVFFIADKNADALCEQIQSAATKARELANGLQLPDKVILGPGGQPIAQVPPSPEVSEHMGKLRSVGEASVGTEGYDEVAEQLQADEAPPESDD